MYRKEKKIPTILALCILFIAVSGIVLLDKTPHQLGSQAQVYSIPSDIHFANISDRSFSVSWFTSTNVSGLIEVKDNQRSMTYLDDADTDNISRPRSMHFITVKNLIADTSYNVKLISGDTTCKNSQSCPTFTQKTGARIANTTVLPAARGSIILEDNNPADNAVIYITVGKSSPLSTRSDSLGLWVIPFSNLRTNDLLSHPNLSDSDIIQIIAKVAPDRQVEALVDAKSIRQNLTIPTLQIGKSYNLIDLISKKDLLAGINNSNTLGLQTQIGSPNNMSSGSNLKSIDILFPATDGDTTTDNQPRFRGIGIAGNQVIITVNSVSPQIAKIIIGSDNTWTWRPPYALEPGVHHIGISTYDKQGNLISLSKRFIVLKSGEQVLGEATASATLTPTIKLSPSPTLVALPSPTITLTPLASPTIYSVVSTGSASTTPNIPPKTGSTKSTLLLLGGGVALLLLGMKFLIFP